MLHLNKTWFKDDHDRTLWLRGVNLGGSSKLPTDPDGATWRAERFFEHRQVSFVGRPFPLAEADQHFARLRRWGLTFIRFLITWEAIEHAGPGIYDEAYLDYLTAVVKKAGEHGLTLFIDPHEDVWSRFTGGDGAPGWTLETVGFHLPNLHASNAAFVHSQVQGDYPRMIWPTNNEKLAAATMWTLFFAGDDFAPQLKVDGAPIQQFLQQHYFDAVAQVAERLKGMPHVVGYDVLNEPSTGWIGWKDLRMNGGSLRRGATPTPWQSMLMGEGYPQLVALWDLTMVGLSRIGLRIHNNERIRAWQEERGCIWRQHGVWDLDSRGHAHLIQPHYFATRGGRAVDFTNDYYKPFAEHFTAAIRTIDPDALIFIENEPQHAPPVWGTDEMPGLVNAAHWYDNMTLFMKHFSPSFTMDTKTGRPYFGRRRKQEVFRRQLAAIQDAPLHRDQPAPTIIGETGIPMDMRKKRAYHTGKQEHLVQALDATMQALEANLLPFTLWNYTADNTNQHGDLWNDEDLSIFSRDQQHDPAEPDSGARAMPAFRRPYPTATAGEPLSFHFDIQSGRMTYTFHGSPITTHPTEFYVPVSHYPRGFCVHVSDGRWEADPEAQRLTYWHSPNREEHTVVIERS
ncbi:MAG: cellulase family glycosylhydrolase [Anaerolineae bacterium]|nr:cellulase family glycosylhydrolase [Anaerolineae bacterium]